MEEQGTRELIPPTEGKPTRLFVQHVSCCADCPAVIVSDFAIKTTGHFCSLKPPTRRIDNPHAVPPWCPLPPIEDPIKEDHDP